MDDGDRLISIILHVMKEIGNDHRKPGTCDRCADVGDHDVPMIGIAKPPVDDWPTFHVCESCAVELAKPAFGEKGYTILRSVQ